MLRVLLREGFPNDERRLVEAEQLLLSVGVVLDVFGEIVGVADGVAVVREDDLDVLVDGGSG